MSSNPRSKSKLIYVVGVLALVFTLLGVAGMGLRRSSQARAQAGDREEALRRGPRVRVAAVTRSPAVRELLLQGEAHPFATVTLYAKVSGYLRQMKVDKGDRVKANQLIATIYSPEIDQQYQAATADAKNKRANAKRFNALSPSGVVSAQELELAQANADVADATRAAMANQRDYRIIRAPFDGVVTARFADPGALIQSAANGQSGAVPIVTVSQSDTLRVYVYLDQETAPFVKVGDVAEVRVPERPGFSRKAQVTRTAGELAPRTRTMLTEVDVDNHDGAILAGSFVRVALQTKRTSMLEIPAEALSIRGDKPSVALVDASQHLHYRPVVVADDDGTTVRLQDGLEEGALVALNLGNDAEDGAQVQVIRPPPPPPGPATARRQ
jgi:RND family efflux transporter MFP subunit